MTQPPGLEPGPAEPDAALLQAASRLPKVVLHDHLDGSLREATLLTLLLFGAGALRFGVNAAIAPIGGDAPDAQGGSIGLGFALPVDQAKRIADELISTEDEPDHQALCEREQAYLLRAIRENLDLSDHMADAVNSLRIVLAADESFRTGRVVVL